MIRHIRTKLKLIYVFNVCRKEMGHLIDVVSLSQNRITVPKHVRKKLKEGVKISWREDGGKF